MSITAARRARLSLIILAAGLILMLAFTALSEVVLDARPVLELDTDLAQAMFDAGETPLTGFSRIFTLLGNEVLYLLGVALGLWFILRRQWTHLFTWTMAVGVGKLINIVLKDWFARPRPAFPGWINPESSFGYPSGHAMMAMLAYGMLAVFIWQAARGPLARSLALKLAGTLILLIALTRVTLHVHYLSDVIGGLVAGGLWLGVCAALFFVLTRPAIIEEAQASRPASDGVRQSSGRQLS